jgi:hypothetical protein
MNGTRNARRGNFIVAIFECEYGYAGKITVIRLSKEAETVTAEGLDTCALSFALKLQIALAVDLNAIDMEYSFNVALRIEASCHCLTVHFEPTAAAQS